MKKKYKILIVLIVIAIIALALIINLRTTGLFSLNKQQPQYIKIGFASSLSGQAGIWGQDVQKGFDFAVKEVNEQGGINGKLIKPVYVDDGCDPKMGTTAYNKLVNTDHIKIITGTVCSTVAMAVAPTTQKNRVLFMASGASSPDLKKQGDLIFRVYPSDTLEIKTIITNMIIDKNITKFGLIYMNDDQLGVTAKGAVEKTIKKYNDKITDEETYSVKDKDFKTIILKVINSNPQAIYIASLPEQTPLIINQLRELRYKGIILGYAGSLYLPSVITKIKDKSNLYYPSPVIVKQTSFWKDYKQYSGKDPNMIMGVGYDSMKLIEAGLKVCGEDNNCIRDYWTSLKNYPTTRGNISYDKDGDVTGIKFDIKELN